MAKIICTICARGGSKGIKNKNIKLLNKKPLIAYTIEQAKESNLFNHIIVSTDSEEIATTAIKYGAEVFFKRSSELSSDTAGKLAVIKDAFIKSETHYGTTFDYLIDLDATAPLRNIQDIINSYQQFLLNDNDNLITAMPSRRSPYFNLIEVDSDGKVALSKKPTSSFARRQDTPNSYDMNASIYIWKRATILYENSLFLDKTGLYIMPEERSIDIDNNLDFEFVEFLMKKQNRHEGK